MARLKASLCLPRMQSMSSEVVASAALFVALAAGAQTPGADAQTSTVALEEITVTAQRREERLHDVPIAISAFDRAALESRNITRLENIQTLVPNLKIVGTGFTGSKGISLRGAVTFNLAPFFDPTVGTYVDGVYIPRNLGNTFDLPNLDRVEVLRGPQGTLYGRNTLAGALNITTQKPTGEFGGKLKISGGNYGQHTEAFSLDFPRMGALSLKLTGLDEGNEGFQTVIDNPLPNVIRANPKSVSRADKINTQATEIAARLRASDSLLFDYAFDYLQAKNIPQAGQITHLSAGGIFDPTSARYIGGHTASNTYTGFPLDLYATRNSRSDTIAINGGIGNSRPYEKLSVRAHRLTSQLDLDSLTLKSITAFRSTGYGYNIDIDGSPLSFDALLLASQYSTFSQELQAIGSFERFKYTAGLYYFRDKGTVSQPAFFFGGKSQVFPQYTTLTRTYAAYAQVEYDPPVLNDALTIIGGVRYNNDLKSAHRQQAVAGIPGFTIPPGTGGQQSFGSVTPALTLKYDVSHNVNLYAKFSQGFKSGGFNMTAPTVAESGTPFKPERVNSSEIGSKMRLADGRVELNVAGFWDDHKDMQLAITQLTPGGTSQGVVRNAGSATIKGIELDAQAVPADWLRLRGAVGYMSAKYDEFITLGVNVADDTALPLAPKWTASASADIRLSKMRTGELHYLLDYSHSSKYYSFAYSKSANANVGQNANETAGESFNLVDMRLALVDIPIGGVISEVSIWSKNIFDQHYRISGIDYGQSFGGLVLSFYNQPRTFGADISIKW